MNAMPTIDLAATGSNIVRMRRSAGMTVQDLQQVFGFSTPQAIYKWQRGAAMPTLDNLVVLAAVFGTTLDAIIVRTGARG
ncbi:MAG: helix-turn-helix transcriptional regulator [Clostridia bacterium]|nr:helix-turn-helix transcriptional regulator [Clostridia bacterium]